MGAKFFIRIFPLFLLVSLDAANLTTCNETNLRNAIASGGSIRFSCDGLIQISQSIVVSNDVILDASGRTVTLRGSGTNRIFEVRSNSSLSLINLTLVDGVARGAAATATSDGGNGRGGAIVNDGGTLNLLGCVFSNNLAEGGSPYSGGPFPRPAGDGSGGAIWNNSLLNSSNCLFHANHARSGNVSTSAAGSGFGGAVFSIAGLINIFHSTFSTNEAVGGTSAGGGVWTSNTVFHSQNSIYTQNQLRASSGFNGAGLYLVSSTQYHRLDGDTFSQNRGVGSGQASGGGIYSSGGTLSLKGVRLIGNEIRGGGQVGLVGGASSVNGGGLSALGTSLILTESVIASNRVVGADGFPSGEIPGFGSAAYGGGVASFFSLAMTNVTLGHNEARGGGLIKSVWATRTRLWRRHLQSWKCPPG